MGIHDDGYIASQFGARKTLNICGAYLIYSLKNFAFKEPCFNIIHYRVHCVHVKVLSSIIIIHEITS